MAPWCHIATAFLLLILPSTSQAQQRAPVSLDADFRFERLDGLSHNTVLSLIQDHQGFLWIGTSDGLHRYDGYTFTVYQNVPGDSSSLTNNTIKVLFEDRNDRLWVGTDGGLQRFDRRNETFVHYDLDGDRQTTHPAAVFALLEDKAGCLWIASAGGLYRNDPETESPQRYRHKWGDPHSLASNQAYGLFKDREGALWITTTDGVLHRYKPEADHFQRFDLTQASSSSEDWSFPRILYEDERGRLWITSRNVHEPVGFDPTSGRTSPLPEVFSDQQMSTVREDRQGILWVGTSRGLYRYDPATGQRLLLRTDPSSEAYLQNTVMALHEDQAGALWVGTLSGLYRTTPQTKPFMHLQHDPTNANSLSSNTVMTVWEDRSGVLWVGTLGGGLNRVNRREGNVIRYRHRDGQPASLCSDLIWSFYEDRRGMLWIGTEEGLCLLNRQTDRFTRVELPLDSAHTNPPIVNALREDQQGRLWIASNIGLYRLDLQTGAVKWFTRPDGDHGGDAPQSFFIQSLHVDRAGVLWIGTFGGRLYHLDAETNSFTRHPVFLANEKELISEGIWAIHEDAGGGLWLGSDRGLTHFDPHAHAVRHYGQGDGLPSSIVYAILKEDQHRLWLSTSRGLARFDERLSEGQQFRVYDTGDGLRNTEFNRRAAFKSRSGTLFFGGLEGLTSFVPTQIRDNPYRPPVVITRIVTSNRDTTIAANPYGLDRLALSYRDYAVSFDFAALNYANTPQNRYAYRLEGFDDGWVEAGTRRYAQYTNLPPGSYVFHVKGSNDDGIWNEEGVSLAITVAPPYWQTWWFRLLIAGLVVATLTLAYRYRVTKLLEMERLRLRIASDLHDDVGSKLSSIALMSEVVRERVPLPEREARRLSTVSEVARDLVGALRDIVWIVNPERDHVDDLVERLHETASGLLNDTTFSWDGATHALPDVLPMEVRRNVFLVYKEALHNVARHARATHVDVRLDVQRDTLVLIIADDGVGFRLDGKRNGHGLESMRRRAGEIGGTLHIESVPGRGTAVTLTAPLK